MRLSKEIVMARIDTDIPDRLDMKITKLVEQGEFATREEALQELISAGVRAYETTSHESTEPDGYNERDDMMGHDDEYVF